MLTSANLALTKGNITIFVQRFANSFKAVATHSATTHVQPHMCNNTCSTSVSTESAVRKLTHPKQKMQSEEAGHKTPIHIKNKVFFVLTKGRRRRSKKIRRKMRRRRT